MSDLQTCLNSAAAHTYYFAAVVVREFQANTFFIGVRHEKPITTFTKSSE